MDKLKGILFGLNIGTHKSFIGQHVSDTYQKPETYRYIIMVWPAAKY